MRFAMMTLLLTSLLGGTVPAVASEDSTDSMHRLTAEQTAAIVDMQQLGEAIMAWLTDRGTRLDQLFLRPWDNTVDIGDFDQVWTSEEIAAVLVPDYIDSVPTEDPWGSTIGFYIGGNPRVWPAFAIRMLGSNQVAERDSYRRGTYPPEEDWRDIVWIQTGFASWPEF